MGANTKHAPEMLERELFLAALEKDSAAERAAFLDAACAGDPALRQKVVELLQEQEQVGGFLETPALAGAAGFSSAAQLGPGGTVIAGAVTEKPGDRIG